jgi:RNA polymerase sigma factor (sigma-70 family)
VNQLDVSACVVRSAAGDQDAWDQLVARFTPLLWAVARGHRLGDSDAADAVQGTWLRLVENLQRIREPERVGAWLATTCRRECLTTLRRTGREKPLDLDRVVELPAQGGDIDAELLRRERNEALWSVFEGLSDPCRQLLRVLMADPPPSYDEVSAALGMPIGSIGPTRGRCLQRLHALVVSAGITRDDQPSVSGEKSGIDIRPTSTQRGPRS